MENTSTHESWDKILERFSSYEGTVTNICRENYINKSQFYYHKKRAKSLSEPTFHSININTAKDSDNIEKTYKAIRVQIGRANIFIPTDEEKFLKIILKELTLIC